MGAPWHCRESHPAIMPEAKRPPVAADFPIDVSRTSDANAAFPSEKPLGVELVGISNGKSA
jgi:hypothetical protein